MTQFLSQKEEKTFGEITRKKNEIDHRYLAYKFKEKN